MDVRLYISVPSNRDWKGKFGASLACLINHLSSFGIKAEGYVLKEFLLRAWGQSSCLSITRQSFLDEIFALGFTHHLTLDDDMTFPEDIVDRLIAHGKDVVSVNARAKKPEVQGCLTGMDGKPLSSTGRTGLEQISLMGGAIYLARVDSFKYIPKPHYQVIWSPQHNNYVGEDVGFAALLRAHSVEMYCDHDASQLVGHIGEHEYKW